MSFSNYFTHKPGGDKIFSVEAPKTESFALVLSDGPPLPANKKIDAPTM